MVNAAAKDFWPHLGGVSSLGTVATAATAVATMAALSGSQELDALVAVINRPARCESLWECSQRMSEHVVSNRGYISYAVLSGSQQPDVMGAGCWPISPPI